jgi:cytochrome b561
MKARSRPAVPYRDRYSSSQIALHWLVVVLVLFQLSFNGDMSRAYEIGVRTGELPRDEGGVVPHAAIGLSILLVMSARLWLRLSRGVPPPPSSESRWMQIVSRSNHWAFYGVLISMPLLGLLAVLTLQPIFGWLHGALAWVLVALVLLHVAGALVHWVRPGSDAHRRMMRAYSDPPTAD